ncbi:hypothetical protein RZS08_05110, partial [Arthrospira platensis SPKY1]|nr:hypothetical protein [Arthrospira platensis SPKY1]
QEMGCPPGAGGWLYRGVNCRRGGMATGSIMYARDRLRQLHHATEFFITSTIGDGFTTLGDNVAMDSEVG